MTKPPHILCTRTHPEVYDPAEDTFLLADNLIVKKEDRILEIGVGSGYVSLMASENAKIVVGTDINIHAVRLAKSNAKLNNIQNVDFILADMFGPVGKRFDLIVFNPPYLPKIEGVAHKPIDSSWNGGDDGREVISRFLIEVAEHLSESGRILMIQSSISDNDVIKRILAARGLETRTIAKKRYFFETICLIEVTRSSRPSATSESDRPELGFEAQTQTNAC